MLINKQFLTSGIGGWPNIRVPEASEDILNYFNQSPFWPELYNLTPTNSYLVQYLGPLLKLGLLVNKPQGKPFFQTQDPQWLEKQTAFYQLYLDVVSGDKAALDSLAPPYQVVPGFYSFLDLLKEKGPGNALCLKGQLGGPIALAMELTDEAGMPAYYNLHLRDMITKSLALHGTWQVHQLKSFGLPVIMAIDETGLAYHGTSTFITLNAKDMIADLNCVLGAIEVMGGIPCLHICGKPNWPIALSTRADIISFHTYEYKESLPLYAKELYGFLERGGTLGWGIIPCQAKALLQESPISLYRQLNQCITKLTKKGIPLSLLSHGLITPNCGLSSLSDELSVKACTYTKEVGDLVNTYLWSNQGAKKMGYA